MKSSLFSALSWLIAGCLVCAQIVPGGTVSARDGFTKPSTEVLFTRGGKTQILKKEIRLTNGLSVRPDGSVLLPNGEKTSLLNNQLLTFQGTMESVALSPEGTAPVSSVIQPVN
jgi:hypothetical protein